MIPQKSYTWSNWAENYSCTAQQYVEPTSINEVIQIVKQASSKNQKIRVVASGHSFSPIALSDEVLISVDKLNQVISLNDDLTLTCQAGINLHDLYAFMKTHEVSLPNYGVIDKQTLAGVIATGTHGKWS